MKKIRLAKIKLGLYSTVTELPDLSKDESVDINFEDGLKIQLTNCDDVLRVTDSVDGYGINNFNEMKNYELEIEYL